MAAASHVAAAPGVLSSGRIRLIMHKIKQLPFNSQKIYNKNA